MHTAKMSLYFITTLILILLITPSFAFQQNANEGMCVQEQQSVPEKCEESSTSTNSKMFPPNITSQKQFIRPAEIVTIYFFEGRGCQFCEKEKVFLEQVKSKYKGLQIKQYEVWHNRQNAMLMSDMLNTFGLKPQGVPVTFIGEKVFIGFSEQIRSEMQDTIQRCFSQGCNDPFNKSVGIINQKDTSSHSSPMDTPKEQSPIVGSKQNIFELPVIGSIETSDMSLPVLTFIIAGLDSFNPCAFFVLFALLGLLTHAGSRKKIFFVGGIFVFFSGFIYFIFMAAWLNLFIFMGHVSGITTTAGIISIAISLINIKDFFAFKKGVSLTIPDSAKPGLFDRMRKLMKSTSSISILFGTVVLAVTANSYELLCTAGFPLVYTRILTLNDLSVPVYYLYLVFYNLVYVIPLFAIVVLFGATFGKKKLTERQGRLLKLMSGVMMLELGTLLLFKPELLNNVGVSAGLLASALLATGLASYLTKKD
jgi:glutaredoxin